MKLKKYSIFIQRTAWVIMSKIKKEDANNQTCSGLTDKLGCYNKLYSSFLKLSIHFWFVE
jgi:hypothetical protein